MATPPDTTLPLADTIAATVSAARAGELRETVRHKRFDRTPRPLPSWRTETPSLMTSLANAGWGELSGHSMRGVRNVLDALVRLLPYGSAAGKLTAYDVAVAAGYSTRWTASRLHFLEDLGVLEWTRGGITINTAADRYGTPGWFRIIKTRLVELILAARKDYDVRLAAHRAEVLERIRKVKTQYTRTRLRNRDAYGRGGAARTGRPRTSDHMELSANPVSSRGGPGGFAPRPPGSVQVKDSIDAPTARVLEAPSGAAPESSVHEPSLAAIRAALAAAKSKLRRS